MSNNTINTLIKNINRQRPALNELIKKGESIVQRNEKKNEVLKNLKGVIEDVIRLYKNSEKSVTFSKGELNIMHLKSERTRLIKWISIIEKKIELVINKLSYAKAIRDAINDEFKNYDTIKLKNKNTPVKLRKLSNNINKTVNNFKDLK
jgi:hypothetical protein